MSEETKTKPLCNTCKRPATCKGAYEGQAEETYSCDDCCGHGNEDGHCELLETKTKGALSDELRMSGQNARIIILNCHGMLSQRFRDVPLWSMVGMITGHGSGNSAAICESANLDPHQPAGSKKLKDTKPVRTIDQMEGRG